MSKYIRYEALIRANQETRKELFGDFMIPDPWYIKHYVQTNEFILHMLKLGTPIELSLVGVFDSSDSAGRGSRRDIELPLHRDGEYSAKLAEQQGGYITPPADIDYVGLYCLRGGTEPCYTTLETGEEIDLQPMDMLVLDNKAVQHGRRGSVGERLLLRMWVKKYA